MDTEHRFLVDLDDATRDELRALGFDDLVDEAAADEHFGHFVAVEIWESDERWPAVVAASKGWRTDLHQTSSSFTDDEIRAARWSSISPTWVNGYPKPEGSYEQRVYGASRCSGEMCGMGRVQEADFRMSGEPRWGKGKRQKNLTSFHWVVETMFARIDGWRNIIDTFNLETRTVRNTREEVLKTAVQLVPNETVNIDMDGFESWTCDECGRTKYAYTVDEFFPRVLDDSSSDLVHTEQSFGAERGDSWRETLVSNRLACAILDAGFHDIRMCPAADE